MKADLHITAPARAAGNGIWEAVLRSASAVGLELRIHETTSPAAERFDNRLSAILVVSAAERTGMSPQTKTPVIVVGGGPFRKDQGPVYILPEPSGSSPGLWPDLFASLCLAILMRRLYHDALRQVEAFEANSELSRRELLELKKAFMAQEAALEYSRQERMDYQKELKAREEVSEFGRKELMDSREILEAWDRFYLFVVEELKGLHHELEAQERTIELSGEERKRSDQTLKAMDALMEEHRLHALREFESLDRMTDAELAALLKEEGLWKSLETSSDPHQLVLVIKALFKTLLRRVRRSTG